MLEIVFFHSAIRGEMTFLTEMFINFLDAMENPDDMPVSDEEFQTLRNDFMSFAKVLRAHNAAEDKLLFPVIIARNPAGREPLERLMVDHLHIGANLKELLRLIDLYLTTPHEDGARLALLRNIVTLMGRLRIQMYAHLYREETVLQSLMAGKMSPEEQNMIVGRIMGHRSSELMEIIIRLLYRHLPKAELEVCLEKINKSVSGTYFERWLATLSGQLETRTDNSDDNDGSMWASHSSSKIAPTYSDIEQRHRSKKKRKRKSSTGSDRSNAEARIDSSAMDFADPNASSPALRIPAETLPPEVLPTVGPSAAESSIRTSENMPSSDGGNNADSISRQPSMHSLSSAPSNSSASSNEEEALPDLESEKDRGYHTEEIETHKAVAKLITGASSDFIQRAIAKVRRDFESAPVATIQHIIEMVTGAQKELQRKGLSADAFADGDISSKVDPSSSVLVNDKALAAPSPHISTDTAATPSSGTASTDIESTPTSGASPCSGYNESNAESTNAPESIQRHPSDKSLDKSGFVTGSGGISNPLPPSDTASVASSRSTSGSSHRTSRFKASDPIEAVAIPVLSDPVDLEPSYFDADRKILGCKHYRRKCKLIAPCCGRAFVCRLCHDDALQEAHILDRYESVYR
jgi:iron-sulfur cluster repair protein YtfE (RIC family)